MLLVFASQEKVSDKQTPDSLIPVVVEKALARVFADAKSPNFNEIKGAPSASASCVGVLRAGVSAACIVRGRVARSPLLARFDLSMILVSLQTSFRW